MTTIDEAFDIAIQHHQAGRLQVAEQIYRQILDVDPNEAHALHLLGVVACQMGQPEVAEATIRRAIALNANEANFHIHLGLALFEQRKLGEAVACYHRALELVPDNPVAHTNLGNAWKGLGRLEEAEANHRRSVALRPDSPEMYNNLSSLLKDKGKLDEAIAGYRRAVELNPNYVEAHSNLIYTLYFHTEYDARAIAEEHFIWNRQHAEPLTSSIRPHTNDRNSERRLRIGYVSPDFLEHPVARFMLPLLENHDHRNVEIHCYAQVVKPDFVTQQLRSQADHWHSIVSLTDEQVAELVRQHQIDILVDLTLHMAGNRLLVFARKPAPIQVTYLAYAGTSGLRTMDYRFSDPYLDPIEMDESVYSEKTVRLPQSYWCYRPIGDLSVGAIPVSKTGRITFGCLNNFCKITVPTLNVWAKILRRVPNSDLLMHAGEGSHRQWTSEVLWKLGIEPHRLRFVERVPLAEYLQIYQQIDIALDSFPYGGGTTSCDAFWMGVPVITLKGKTAVGRAGFSLAMNLGLAELVASTTEEYERLAVELASDLSRLESLRSTLRERMAASPLLNAPAFVGNIERAYREMWRTWCRHFL